MGCLFVKRDGTREPVSFDKILKRLFGLSSGLPEVNIVLVAQKTIHGLYDGVPMTEKSVFAFGGPPDTVWLFREPILAEWRERGDVELQLPRQGLQVHTSRVSYVGKEVI